MNGERGHGKSTAQHVADFVDLSQLQLNRNKATGGEGWREKNTKKHDRTKCNAVSGKGDATLKTVPGHTRGSTFNPFMQVVPIYRGIPNCF